MWNSIVSVPEHCLVIYYVVLVVVEVASLYRFSNSSELTVLFGLLNTTLSKFNNIKIPGTGR